MRAALFLARADLVHLLRQKETILWTFLMPALFFWFIGTVTGGSGFTPNSEDSPDPLTLVVPYAEQPGDQALAELVLRLESESFAVTRVVEDPGVGRRLELPAPPEGFAHWTAALDAGVELDATLHQARRGSAADLDLLRVGKASYGLLLDLAVFELEGSGAVAASYEELRQRPRALTVDTRSAGARPLPPSGYAQTIPGTMVMFTMLILLTSGSILIVTERRDGLLRRLASAPVSRGSVLTGKWLARMGLAVVQLAFSMVLGIVVFGMDWGEQLPMVCLLLFVWAAFNASLALLLANLVRTEGQMAGVAVLSSMVLAALGGCWWPIEITPGWMQDLAGCLPTGWAMHAMHALVHFGHGPASVAGDLALIGLGALLLGWLGARTFRFE